MTREEAIKVIEGRFEIMDYCESARLEEALDIAIESLKQSQPRWTPCSSKRLPEDWVPVLITLKKPERLPAWIKVKPENYFRFVDTDVCEDGEWSVNKKNVIAWMPLPEPYQPKEDES